MNTDTTYDEYLSCVDVVCANCHYCKIEFCEKCLVRMTCEELEVQQEI